MKEIDTEAPVVWPAWCYSGNIPTDVLKHSPRGVTTSSSSSSSSTSSSSSAASDITSPGTLLLCNPAAAVAYNSAALPTTSTTDIGSIVGVANKFRTKRKSHFTTKQLPTESVDDNSIGQHHLIGEKTKESTRLSSPPLVAVASQQPAHHQHQAHQQTTAKAATASLNAEKMLSDRMLLSGYNAIENNKKLCDSSSGYFFLEKVKNETQMESLKDSESIINNNVNNTSSNNNNNNNNNNNSSTNNNSLSSNNPSVNSNINNNNNNSNIINNNNSNSNSTTSNNSVKRERLSPGTNGDVQFSLSRSRSATPSSFRGTPPQATHTTNDIQLHNLSTNLLSQIQSRSSDFPTRNYSDFMRSLAAKYNNSNPNDSGTSRRSTFFENSKISQTNKSAAASNSTNSGTNTNLKEQPSPSEAAKSTQNVQNLATTTPSVPPFVQSFLSSLPFSPGVFPPLIDMSSTQALVTLARAAKEAEIKNILMSAQKRSSASSNSASQSPGPNLTAALQQAAQFASPALLYSAQLQQQQQQQQSQNRQSSPMRDTSANSSGEKNMTASPLDLSSAPPAKRFKAESTSSCGSEKSPSREVAPGIGATVQTPAKSPKVSATRAPSEVVAATAPTAASVIPMRQCQAQSDEVNAWSVDDVVAFVSSIDICAEYAQNFQDQCIDGSGLPLLTEDHLVNSLGMKLGPALKLKTMLAKKLGGPCPCVSCSSQAQLLAAAQAAAVTVATSSTTSASPPSGISNSQHLHPQPNQQQLSLRNSAACNNSSSQTILHGSCGSSIQRPASAESAS